MADAALLKKGGMKVVAFVVVAVLGRYFLWPDDLPVMDWLQDDSDWKLKFAFVAWAVVAVAMAYDAIAALAKGAIATPPDAKRRR